MIRIQEHLDCIARSAHLQDFLILEIRILGVGTNSYKVTVGSTVAFILEIAIL